MREQPAKRLFPGIVLSAGESPRFHRSRDVPHEMAAIIEPFVSRLSTSMLFRECRVWMQPVLRGLSREETGQLVESTAGIRPGTPVVDTVFTHTDGNPYFMTELVRLLASRGELEEAGAAGLQGVRIPEGVREVIGQRLNRLSENCNRVLTTASVIGREFRRDQLIPLLEDISGDQLLEALEEALQARPIGFPLFYVVKKPGMLLTAIQTDASLTTLLGFSVDPFASVVTNLAR